jgi:hypothetical protein
MESDPSAFIVQMAKRLRETPRSRSRERFELKAMRDPSGDHVGE